MEIQVNHWYIIKSTRNITSLLWVKEIGGCEILNYLDEAWVAIPKHWRIEGELPEYSPLVTEAKKEYYGRTIKVTVEEEEVFIEWNDFEVVKWIKDEWIEDPEICVCIANAIRMAYVDPERLIDINKIHIQSQIDILKNSREEKT